MRALAPGCIVLSIQTTHSQWNSFLAGHPRARSSERASPHERKAIADRQNQLLSGHAAVGDRLCNKPPPDRCWWCGKNKKQTAIISSCTAHARVGYPRSERCGRTWVPAVHGNAQGLSGKHYCPMTTWCESGSGLPRKSKVG